MKLVSNLTITNPFTEEIYVKSTDGYEKISTYNNIIFLYERYFELRFFVDNIEIKIEIDLLWYNQSYHIILTKDVKNDYSYVIQFK
jgi:hypothetical protein